MAFDETLAARVRAILLAEKKITEKRMFGGLAFLRDGKMCVTVSKDRLMLRVEPSMHEQLIEQSGCSTVIMRGLPYRGWIHVTADALKTQKAFMRYIHLALSYSP